MKRLGVNIDHVATLRNARGEVHPSPIKAAIHAIKYGANSVTLHLREDRRHINDKDFLNILKNKKIPVNLEIAATKKMLNIAFKNKPKFICIVPENRKEITTEGGLNLIANKNKLINIVKKINKKKIRSSLFINPKISDVILSKKIGTKCIEIHTGRISNKIKDKKIYYKDFLNIKKCAQLAHQLGLEVHAGHGMDYKTAKILSRVKEIKEFNIGHFIIGESIFDGLKYTIKNFIKIIK